MKTISRNILVLIFAVATTVLSADYATEYRELYYKWQAADKSFKDYTKDLEAAEPSDELKKKAENLGVEFHQAKRAHPALAAKNAEIDELQEKLATAIQSGDYAQKAEIQKKINAAMSELGTLAKEVPELVDLEKTYIQAMEAANESKWVFDDKALELYRKVETLRREIADLRAANGQ